MIKNQQNRALFQLFLVAGLLNAFLFSSKFYLSFQIHSLALRTEALNQLGDVFNLFLFALALFYATLPADKEHPYGHARMEYVAGLALASTLFYLGFSLLFESISLVFWQDEQFVFYPEALWTKTLEDLSWTFKALMIFSISVKLTLALVYKHFSKRWSSPTLNALSEDSRMDALQSLVLFIALSVEQFLPFAVDKFLSIGLSIYMMIQASKMWWKLLSQILGEGLEDEERKEFLHKISTYPEVLGVHDLRVHRYGPHQMCLTCHLELPAHLSFHKAHRLAHEIEHDFWHQEKIELLIHIDPVSEQNQKLYEVKKTLKSFLEGKVNAFALHDVQFLEKEEGQQLHFEIMLPYEDKTDDTQLKQATKYFIERQNWAFDVHFYIERGVLLQEEKAESPKRECFS